ncbi:hypothetical protein FACS1894147_04360 [Spirochaetia bacterium]|nr:hypothetical protein FACS1894147_04360 [Spirochaetia bacterium]
MKRQNFWIQGIWIPRIWILCGLLMLTGTAVYATGGQQGAASRGNAAATSAGPNAWKEKYATPVTLTFGRDGVWHEWKNGEYFDNSVYSRYIKDTLNVDVKMAWIASSTRERVTLAIASNDLPDVMLVYNRLQLNQLFIGDMVADLTGLYDVYAGPVLKTMVDSFGGLKEGMYTTFYNGKQLAMSDLNLGNQDQMFWVREDWRLKLRLPEPKTTADFIALAEAFVKNDMAGSKQTIGFEVNSGSMIAGSYNGVLSFDIFFNEVGAYPRVWHEDSSGKLVYGSVTPQAKEALGVIRDMYSKGLIAKDFATRDTSASMASGYPGLIVGPWWSMGASLYTTVQNNPSAVWKPYSYVSSKDGKAHTVQQNYNGGWHVVRKGHPNPEALLKLLSLHAEFQSSNEAPTLTAEEKQKLNFSLPDSIFEAYLGQSGMDWGAWPTHLALRFNDHIIRQANNLQTQLDQYRKGERNFPATELNSFEMFVRYENGDKSYDPQFGYNNTYAKFLQAELSRNMVKKAAFYPSVTPTQEQRWANLTDMEILAYTRIIMGQEPLSYFDTFVREWNAQGGSRITDEVNQLYKAR